MAILVKEGLTGCTGFVLDTWKDQDVSGHPQAFRVEALMTGPDPFQLERFVEAQDPIFSMVLRELRQGHKQTHWMWFVFPQIAGLGHSATADRYAIRSTQEAEAYLARTLLGGRLRECTALVLTHKDKNLREIFGAPDDLKFRSSMTLFDYVAPGEIFGDALRTFRADQTDEITLAIIEESASDGL